MSNVVKKRATAAEKVAQTTDSFYSFADRVRGVANQDRLGGYNSAPILNQQILNAIYRDSWLCAKVVDCLAEDMTKDGIKISGLAVEEEQALQKYLTEQNIWRDLTRAIKWGRLYGGAVCFLNIEGQDTEAPLDINTVSAGQFLGLLPLDRYRIAPENFSNLFQQEPDYYCINEVGLRIHKSRIVKFIGVELPYNLAMQEEFWGDSIVRRIFDRIRMRDGALKGSARLVDKAWLRTVKVEGLRAVIAAGGMARKNLEDFFKVMADLQDSTGLTIMDKNDDFQTNSYTFSGLEQLLRTYDLDVAGAADIPITRLYGQSPAGFSTGDSDLKSYYDKISTLQESMLREPLTLILNLCYLSLFGRQPQDGLLDFEFLNPWQPSELEDRAQAVTESDVIIRASQAGLIDIDTAMKELRERGKRSGLFGSITDEDIAANAADNEPPLFEDFDNELERPLEQSLDQELDQPLEQPQSDSTDSLEEELNKQL